MAGQNIVLYDGNCGLCNDAVKRIQQADKRHLFRYRPLQEMVDSGQLPAQYAGMVSGDEVGLLTDNSLFLGHHAVGEILLRLGGVYAFWGRIWVKLPVSLKSRLYRWVASNRHLWPRKKSSCET